MDLLVVLPNGNLGIVDGVGVPLGDWVPPGNYVGATDCVLNWNNPNWTLKHWKITVPTNYYTQLANGTALSPALQISHFVPWLDVRPINSGNVWFADCELYINPPCQSGETSIGPDGCDPDWTCCCS